MKDVDTIQSRARAASLLMHPLRIMIIAQARAPISAAELARRLDQPRQRVNYHVRQLAADGFLLPAGQQRKRNMVEQQYVASARSYVITPEVLGDLAPELAVDPDSSSAAQLLAACARAQSEVATVMESANAAGVRVRTTSMMDDIRFESVEQRAEFTKELMSAVADIVGRHTSAESGRVFRLIVGSYPTWERK